VEKEVTSIRDHADAEADLVRRAFDEFRDLHAARSSRTSCCGANFGNASAIISAAVWGEAIAQLIEEIDLDEEEVKLREVIEPDEGKRHLSVQRKQKAIKRLKIVSAFNRRDESGRRVNDPGHDP